jgi:hypothetical protein
MTAPLSAADEKVLMERFKQATNRGDQVVRLRQRLPRVSRPLPNLLSNETSKSVLQPEAQPSVLPIATAPVVPIAGELPSAAIYRQIVADNDRLMQMQSSIGVLTQQMDSMMGQLKQVQTDFDAAKAAYNTLTVKYSEAIEQEAKDILAQRKAELAAVGSQPVVEPSVVAPKASPKRVRKAPAKKVIRQRK